MSDTELKEQPFSWNDRLADAALEDFSFVQKDLSYGVRQTIGTALAKLKMMEDKGMNPDTMERIVEQLEAKIKESYDYTAMKKPEYIEGLEDAIDIAQKAGAE